MGKIEHNTPLQYHFKRFHIWFDMGLLVLLFVVAAYYPLLKIVPLVASLELFSFFSFHLLTKNSRFQAQGFLGGFISSTAVFLQTLNDKKFAAESDRNLLLTLLFALCAMLLECLFIIFFLAENMPFIYYLPFLTQLVCTAAAILYVTFSARFASAGAATVAAEFDMLNDRPIIWKNVAKLSLIILAIISTMHFVGTELGFPRSISTLLVSLFEAHAILASVMTQWSLESQGFELMSLFLVILLGNAISKSYFVLSGANLRNKGFFVFVMVASFGLSALLVLLSGGRIL
tara:strand:+ start:52 stop:918 length:867 start_codon:yes stop_codon:yes gene_type:complete